MTHHTIYRRTLAGVAAAVLLVGLAGCGGGGAEAEPSAGGTPEAAPSALPNGMGSSEEGDVFPRTVTHFKGEVEIPEKPERIVVLGTGQVDGLLALDIVPAGAVADDGEVVQPYMEEVYPDLKGEFGSITSTGSSGSINYEKIAALKPDLILDGGGEEAEGYDTLTAIAPTVITEGSGLNWKQDFLLLASAVGQFEAAQSVLDGYLADATELSDSFAGEPPEVTFLRFHADRTRIYGEGSFAGSIGADAGLLRPKDQQFSDTSLDISEEQIALIDSNFLFYAVQGADDDTPAEQFIANPLWENLPVVAEGNLLEVPHDPFFNSAGPGAAQLVLDVITGALKK